MNIEQIDKKLILTDIKDFEPKHIFECGQCFRWLAEEDGSYTGVAHGRVINVKKDGDKIIIDNTNKDDFINIWMDYFDLSRDYGQIKDMLEKKDEYLYDAVRFGHGIRILKQDAWEVLISFIISANNRIMMIQRVIDNISKKYGRYIDTYRGKDYYSFPTPEELSKASIEDLRACSTGFRDKYIKATTQSVLDEGLDPNSLRLISGDECRKKLMTYKGVGAKVADCIALFGMQKFDSFPVDVWVKRVMVEFYGANDMSLPKMRKFGLDLFGEDAGFAQQYLFYYVRENQIGK